MTGPPPIKALLFDFDGTILETEESCFLAWREIFDRHGRDLNLGEWESAVGTVGGFDPVATLREHTGGKVDIVAVLKEQATRRLQLLEGEGLRPGILPLLEEALEALRAVDQRKCEIIELNYLLGLKREEIAEVLELSVPTIDRELRFARAWLKQRLAA